MYLGVEQVCACVSKCVFVCLCVCWLMVRGCGIAEALSVVLREEVALRRDRALIRKLGAAEKTSDTHLQLWRRQQKNEPKVDALEILKFHKQWWEGA